MYRTDIMKLSAAVNETYDDSEKDQTSSGQKNYCTYYNYYLNHLKEIPLLINILNLTK